MTRTYDEAAEAVFDQASQLIKDLPKTVKVLISPRLYLGRGTDAMPTQVTDTQKLRFYGLLQQATQGDCTLPQPRVQGSFNILWSAIVELTDLVSSSSRSQRSKTGQNGTLGVSAGR